MRCRVQPVLVHVDRGHTLLHAPVRRFLQHIELWLSCAGLLVVWAVTLTASAAEPWKAAALTALGVSVVLGVVFWAVRTRQRRVRAEAAHESCGRLTDEAVRPLAVIAASISAPALADYADQIGDVRRSVATIGEMVTGLTEERLTDWKAAYANAHAQYSMT